MIRTRNPRRSGFTLIELLVTMGIIIVLGSLALLISPRFAEDQRTTRGADQASGWILVAKMRAYRDQQPRGVRLILDPANPTQVKEMLYIERPEDLRGDPDPSGANDLNHLLVPIPVAPYNNGAAAQWNQFVYVPNWDLQTGDLVLPGDFLKINTYETQPYNIHRIAGVSYKPNGFPPNLPRGTVLQLAAADGPGGSAGTPSIVVPSGRIAIDADTRYQIIRQARPMAGEPNLPLPRDVVIDLAIDPNIPSNPPTLRSVMPGIVTNQPLASPPQPTDFLDILFSQRGQVMGSNANGGKVILRVRQGDKAADYGEQIYIVIHTQTGLISAHPVSLSTPIDPFAFTRDGKSSGM